MEISKKLILVVAGLSLGACSSTAEKDHFLTYDALQAKVREHDGQWQSIQTKLKKIDVLEAEVAELQEDKMSSNDTESMKKTTMSSNSAVTEMPMFESHKSESHKPETPMAAMNVSPKVNPVVKAAPMTTAPLKTKRVVTPKLAYGVQLASYTHRDEAIRGWNVLLKHDFDSFDGLKPLVYQKEVNGRDVYQLKVGPFSSKFLSTDFCEMLKEKGKGCFVTQYNGDAFTKN